MTQQVINMAYILGLLEADGSFLLTFDSKSSTLKPEVRISQSSNSNLLGLIESFFLLKNIKCEIEDSDPESSKNRAQNLRITEMGSLKKFIELVKNEPFQFISVKKRDFMIVDRVVNREENLRIEDKINLKKSLHKDNRFQEDLTQQQGLTRTELETRYKIPKGSSKDDRFSILEAIDNNYAAHKTNFEELIRNPTFFIPVEWLTGLIDGDGSYNVTNSVKEQDRIIEFQGTFSITMEKNAFLTVQGFKAAVKSEANIIEKQTFNSLAIRKQREVLHLLQMQEAFLPVGNYRRKQYNLVKKLYGYKAAGSMRDLNTVLSFLDEIYALSDEAKGREKTHSLEEIKEKAREFYGK